MSFLLVFAIVLAIGLVAFVVGRQRARAQDDGTVKPHSRAHYHGWWAFLTGVIPAVLFLAAWDTGASAYLNRHIHAALPAEVADGAVAHEDLAAGLVKSLASGMRRLDAKDARRAAFELRRVAADARRQGRGACARYQGLHDPDRGGGKPRRRPARPDRAQSSRSALPWWAPSTGCSRISPRARARNNVEKVMLWGLLGASTIAILTTIGIVLSMLFQTIAFFEKVPLTNFFFGTVWDPRFAAAGSGGAEGQFGLIPLLAGTLYIAFVALLVAVPVGLMSAIYMAEYAAPQGALGGQAGAGTARRHPDHRLRYLRARHARAVPARHQRRAGRRHAVHPGAERS